MRKTFVLDTCVLLQSSNSIFSFGEDNIVVIPDSVVHELDNFKKNNDDKGFNARDTIRHLDRLREKGKLTEGVRLPNGGELRVEMGFLDVDIPETWKRDVRCSDNRILQICKGLKDSGENVFLITKDIILRVKSEIIDVISEDFKNEQVPTIDEQYTGRISLYINDSAINDFYVNKKLNLGNYKLFNKDWEEFDPSSLVENQFVQLSAMGSNSSAVGVYKKGELTPLYYSNKRPFDVTPRNIGQTFFQEALMRSVNEAPLVIAKGDAGTAKTFLSLAVGLEKVFNVNPKDREYRRILVCRPNIKMDEDLGALPGDEQEKIAPLMRPIYDNLEVLVDSNEKERYLDEKELSDKVRYLFNSGIIVTESVGYLRGRSIVKHWLIIDEAQNLTPKQAKGIITRAGEGTKVILIGDPNQIDHPFLDSRTNGLSYASERMKGSELCFQITFENEECVRSALAMEAAKRL